MVNRDYDDRLNDNYGLPSVEPKVKLPPVLGTDREAGYLVIASVGWNELDTRCPAECPDGLKHSSSVGTAVRYVPFVCTRKSAGCIQGCQCLHKNVLRCG